MSANLTDQCGDVERLLHRAVTAEGFELTAGNRLATQNENRHRRQPRLGAQSADHFVPAHLGHILVQEDEGGSIAAGLVDGLIARRCGDGLESELAQQVLHQRQDGSVIINDKNDRWFVHYHR